MTSKKMFCMPPEGALGVLQDMDAREVTLEEACLLLRKKLALLATRPPRAQAAAASGSKAKRQGAKKGAGGSPAGGSPTGGARVTRTRFPIESKSQSCSCKVLCGPESDFVAARNRWAAGCA